MFQLLESTVLLESSENYSAFKPLVFSNINLRPYNLAGCPPLSEGQEVILPVATPIKKTGHLQCLYGNLAPEGSVAKITGKEGLYFKVRGRCKLHPGARKHHPVSKPILEASTTRFQNIY